MHTEVRVQTNLAAGRYQPAYFLYSVPSMRLHEEGTRWLAARAARHAESKQRNDAYSISYWLSYCLGADLDFREASADDLLDYKSALGNLTSLQTRRALSEGTIRLRLSTAIDFYTSGKRDGWYRLGSGEPSRSRFLNAEVQPIAITDDCKKFLPPLEHPDATIRPFDPTELKKLLAALTGKNGELATRDRLIAEWMCYVGLRISEVVGKKDWNGISLNQILCLRPNPELPTDHCALEVIGKFRKRRNVAVPNWLVIRTQEYIAGERAGCCEGALRESDSLFVSDGKLSPEKRGQPISVRRYEAIFRKACRVAGLSGYTDPSSSKEGLSKEVARHSPHDLRHTYAVMTYFAEREIGNPEPWKPIQAQLGHRHLSTTVDTYLRHVSMFSVWGADLRRMSMRELAGLPRA